MTSLFSRVASVTVGPQAGGEGRKFTGLRVAFNVEKNSESTANGAKIQIWNLRNDSRSLIEQADQQVILEAGYEDNVQQIFIGDITRVQTTRIGPDWITQIEAGDGLTALQTANINKTFTSGSGEEDVVAAVLDIFQAKGLKAKSTAAIGALKSLVKGYSAVGPAKDVLDRVTANNGLEWSIQDKQVLILPIGTATEELFFKISAGTGMVGSPAKTDKGVKFQTLLIPELLPGRGVRLASKAINGDYRISKVSHQGDTHEGQYLSNVEALTI